MDPYIEDPEIWSDFHINLATEIQAILNAEIRPRYVARLHSRVTYEVVEIARIRGVRPDVAVWQPQPPQRGMRGTAYAGAPAPVESEVSMELPLRLVSIEIRQTDSMELVTAVEILSPVNKRPGHEAYGEYLRKRRELLRSMAHLLEIDLLRGGQRPPLETDVPEASYYVILSREERRPKVEVWPIQLGQPLPQLPVPLLAPDPDAQLDLGAAVAAVYERGGYADLIDYNQSPPTPELETAERTLLREILTNAGYR
jgi:hypothetical protein